MRKNWERALTNFFDAMATKLEENKDKGGWKYNKDDWYLHRRLLEEVAEYFISLNAPAWDDLSIIQEFVSAIGKANSQRNDADVLGEKFCTKKEQKRELADVGNIAMMLFDNT